MDRFDAMTVFVAIADGGSLSAAARRLEQPLATVSRKLAQLEAQLKTRLIARSTRRLELTEAGRDYLAAARQILEQVDEAERLAGGAYARPHGQLVISAPPWCSGGLHLLPVIVEFLREFPDVDVRLVQADRVVNLLEEHVDMALRIGELADSGLVATKVGEIRRVACASPAYLAAYGRPQVPADPGAPCVHQLRGSDVAPAAGPSPVRRWTSARGLPSPRPKPPSRPPWPVWAWHGCCPTRWMRRCAPARWSGCCPLTNPRRSR